MISCRGHVKAGNWTGQHSPAMTSFIFGRATIQQQNAMPYAGPHSQAARAAAMRALGSTLGLDRLLEPQMLSRVDAEIELADMADREVHSRPDFTAATPPAFAE